jgi:DNA photolyase
MLRCESGGLATIALGTTLSWREGNASRDARGGNWLIMAARNMAWRKAEGGRRLKAHSKRTTVMWFRADLRLTDNRALIAAPERGGPVVPVFIWSPEEEGSWTPGSASRWWLHQSLRSLDDSLKHKGSRLVLRRGPARKALKQVLEETSADAVYWSRRYEPVIRARDDELKSWLQSEGLEARDFDGTLLVEPGDATTNCFVHGRKGGRVAPISTQGCGSSG